jgi:hypothetical protein
MTALVFVHVLISLAGIVSGFAVLAGFLTSNRLGRTTALFLATTVATSATGFVLPADHFMASHAIAILSLVILAGALFALYGRRLAGPWRWTYVVTALAAQYLNVFVLVVQAFLKVPALRALAPTQSEPPFAVAQLAVLVVFVAFGVASVVRFRPSGGDLRSRSGLERQTRAQSA